MSDTKGGAPGVSSWQLTHTAGEDLDLSVDAQKSQWDLAEDVESYMSLPAVCVASQ